jgi:hypothetical protein
MDYSIARFQVECLKPGSATPPKEEVIFTLFKRSSKKISAPGATLNEGTARVKMIDLALYLPFN